ncbi:MAG: peptide ABC transporter substrate-binding protein [Candidatus Limnocylindrales bacterium]
MFIRSRVARRPAAFGILRILCCLVIASALAGCIAGAAADGDVDVRIGASEPFTWDPAQAGDSGSANVLAQVFEGLTAFDSDSQVQPALADSWQASEDGRQLTFHLRPGIVFSDGTPITAADFVGSWLRLIDPRRPSPLSSLLADVQGALEHRAGQVTADAVGFRADGDNVIVDLRRPATYFLAVTASPSLAVVPPSMYGRLDLPPPPEIVVSGAYVPTLAPGVITLTGNPNYWAGLPPLDHVELVTDYGNKSGVTAFDDTDVDYTGIGAGDASWIRYDERLGPQLRRSTDFTVSYYGFDTIAPPFDRPEVRLAFAKAVDWDRLVRLSDGLPATSMVPAGIPGRDEADHRPTYDPQAARDLLSGAGYTNPADFPDVVLATYGVGFEETVAAQLEENLGVTVNVEVHDFADYIGRQHGPGSPGIWTLAWSADYPHPHDFLGLLLETGSTSNDGGWSNAEYDALIEQAAATADPAEQAVFYAQAQDILQRDAPVVPLAYGESWALARDGLLGAQEAGVGIIRIAGLDWAPGTGRP